MNRRGFTLIELLIALFIYSIVAVIIANSLANLLDNHSRNEAHEMRWEEIQIALSLLERDIEQITNRPIINAIGQTDPALVMDSNVLLQRLEFTRMGYINPLEQFDRSTLLRVAYQFKNHALERFNWPTLDRKQDLTPSSRIILTQVEKMQWKFYDEQNNPYTIWPPTANWIYKLPHAIELTLTLKDKGVVNRLFVLPESYDLFISR